MLIIIILLFNLIIKNESSYGTSWTTTTAPSPSTWWSVSSDSTGEIIYAAESSGIYSSTDGIILFINYYTTNIYTLRWN